MSKRSGAGTDQLLRLTRLLEDGVLVVLLATMIGLAISQILLRNLFGGGLAWADPLLRILVLWVGLAGAMVATREDRHIAIDALTRWLSPRMQLLARVIVDVFTALVCALIAWHAARFVYMDYEAQTIAFAAVPSWVCELILPIGFGVIALRYCVFAVVHTRRLLAGEYTP